MTAYCSIGDVAALLGVPVEQLDVPRTTTLIELASEALEPYLCALPEPPEPVPGPVRLVTASQVARATSNPAGIASEQVSGYRVQYAGSTAAGLLPTAAELDALGPWLCTDPGAAVGGRSYTTALRAPAQPVWPIDWYARDYDTLGDDDLAGLAARTAGAPR